MSQPPPPPISSNSFLTPPLPPPPPPPPLLTPINFLHVPPLTIRKHPPCHPSLDPTCYTFATCGTCHSTYRKPSLQVFPPPHCLHCPHIHTLPLLGPTNCLTCTFTTLRQLLTCGHCGHSEPTQPFSSGPHTCTSCRASKVDSSWKFEWGFKLERKVKRVNGDGVRHLTIVGRCDGKGKEVVERLVRAVEGLEEGEMVVRGREEWKMGWGFTVGDYQIDRERVLGKWSKTWVETLIPKQKERTASGSIASGLFLP